MNYPEYSAASFLTEDEQELLAAERKRAIAQTLLTWGNLLQFYGSTEDSTRDSVANMRTKFSDYTTDAIEAILKSLGAHASVLMNIQVNPPTTIPIEQPVVPNLAIVSPTEPGVAPLENTQVVDIHKAVQDAVITHVSAAEPETEKRNEDWENIEVPEIEPDSRKPKKLSTQLNNAFSGVFTFEQRVALTFIDIEQHMALLRAFDETLTAHLPKKAFVPLYVSRLDKLLEGVDVEQVAKEEGVTPEAISLSFRKSVNNTLRKNRSEFIRKYTFHLGSEIPEAQEQIEVPTHKQVAPRTEKQPKAEILRPEGMHPLINNLLARFLSYEQREVIATFSESQTHELVELFTTVYETNGEKLEDKDRHIARIRALLEGVGLHDIATAEGVGQISIIQNFSKFLPYVFTKYQDQMIAGIDAINKRDVSEGTQRQYMHADQYATIRQESVQPGSPAPQEVFEKPEAFVELMKDIYKTDDPQALAGIEALFSIHKGVIGTNAESIEAANYLTGLLRQKNIELEMRIADHVGRNVIVRLLEGIKDEETGERKYATLSQIIAETPEAFREMKIDKTLTSLRKMSGWLESVAPTQKSEREHNADELREVLPGYTGLNKEIIGEVLDRALGKQGEFTAELSRALLTVYRQAFESGPDEKQIRILKLFSVPRPGGDSMTIQEIKAELAKPGKATMRVEEGWISGMLLRAYKNIVTQRSDG